MHARCHVLLRKTWRCAGRYPYFAVALPVVLALSISFCRREDSEWECVYVVAANHLRDGADLYTDGNSYPPFAAFAALPASFLSPPFVRLSWLGVNLLCMAVMVRGAWHLAGGGRLQGSGRAPVGEHLAAVLGFLCGVCYLQNALAHQQTDVVIGAMLVAGCLALNGSRSLTAATCFGFAAALKCTALLWIPYLVWRGRPLAALWVLVVAIGVNLLPNLISAPPSGQLWLEEYANRFLVPITASDHVVGTWGSDIMYNQSVAGTAQRWFVADRAAPLDPKALRAVVLAIEAALVLATLAVCRLPFRKSPVPSASGINREAVEYGVVLILMLLLSPMSSKAHFGVLIVPGFLLTRAALLTRSRCLWGCTIGAALLALVSNKDLLGEALYTLALWYGTVTWQTSLLLVGSLAVVWRLGTAGNAPTPSIGHEGTNRQAA